MATATKKNVLNLQQFGGVPYGNGSVLPFSFETNAAGVYVDSDLATAVVAGSKVRVGVLPAGMRLDDMLAICSDLFTALVTAAIGFEYADGVDDANVPQNASYFFAALALSATGRTRSNNLAVRPVTLPKDAFLILTTAGADIAAAGQLDLLTYGTLTGTP